MKTKDLPFECYNSSNNYFLYFGDVYFGIAVDHPDIDDGIFIIQNSNLRDYRELSSENRTTDNLKKLGHEIKDVRMISNIIRGDIPLGVKGNHNVPTVYGRTDWRKMFVFGAGASSFCSFEDQLNPLKNYKYRPPLGVELFDQRFDDVLQKYPGALLSIPEYEASSRDIETFLENEWQLMRDGYNPQIMNRHINIQFYFQELFNLITLKMKKEFGRNNLFSLFASKLQKYTAKNSNCKAGIVSFNYDTILDYYLEQHFQIKLSGMNDYIDWNKHSFVLFKPHGSCNWGWKLESSEINLELAANKKDLSKIIWEQKSDLYKIGYNLLGNENDMICIDSWGGEMSNDKNHLGKFSINRDKIQIIEDDKTGNFFPSLLMPYSDKDEFVMPYNHQFGMKVFLHEIEELYLIGWKGNEDLFNRKIQDNAHKLKKIIIVNPNKEEVINNLKKYVDINSCEVIHIKSFDDFVRKEMDALLNQSSTKEKINI